jgi:DNA-binding XRE family transcriptional regulator
MRPSKRKKLQRAGFKVGTVQQFLGLSDEEAALIEMKARLVETLAAARKAAGLTQQQLARRMGSSQSRLAKIEAGAADASMDLICKALLSLGLSSRAIGRILSTRRAA